LGRIHVRRASAIGSVLPVNVLPQPERARRGGGEPCRPGSSSVRLDSGAGRCPEIQPPPISLDLEIVHRHETASCLSERPPAAPERARVDSRSAGRAPVSPRAWLARRDTAVFVGLESTTWRARATARRDEDGPSRQRAGAVALVAILAAVASVAVYREVLDSYFWNDDFVWMYLLRDRSLAEVLFTPIAGPSPAAPHALFALVLEAFWLAPRPHLSTVLATHAVNVLLVCRLVWLLTGNVALAGLGALAWGTCPAASETLAWYSVYGQIAALTCLLAMFCHIARRARASGRLT